LLASQPGLDCCVTGSTCASASSHSTTVYTWSGIGLSFSPSVALYAVSATAKPTLLAPPPLRQPLHLIASVESVAFVISGGASHSWKIQSGGDALSSGLFLSCSAFTDVPCSAGDAVALLPLPAGWSRRVPIVLHVSVTLDYANSAGLADFGVADDDDVVDDDIDDDQDLGHNAERDSAYKLAHRNAHASVDFGLQFERVGNGPASALQVRRNYIATLLVDLLFEGSNKSDHLCVSVPRFLCRFVVAIFTRTFLDAPVRTSFPLAGNMAVAEFYFSPSFASFSLCSCTHGFQGRLCLATFSLRPCRPVSRRFTHVFA
jgi:hypothetical protein